MPRIAVAIFVVVAVAVSIGINIARYPAVFNSAGSTHESLVSNDTTDVSETVETEGTVAVKPMPAMPDEDLAKWNPPMQHGDTPAATEAVPYVASHENHDEETPETATLPETTSEMTGESTTKLKEYEVQPYHPYTSQPRVENSTRTEEEETPAETPYREVSSESYKEPENTYHDDSTAIENDPGYDNNGQNSYSRSSVNWGESNWTNSRPADNTSTPEDRYDDSDRSDEMERFDTTSTSAATPESERRPTGLWPATVAETFRYRNNQPRESGSFYDRQPTTTASDVATTTGTPSASNETPSQPSAPDDTPYETTQWKAAVPMVAIRNNYNPSDEEMLSANTPLTPYFKRLPEVRGADMLPGALPPSQIIAYPMAK
ncbi:MAG: hypothetical protein PVH19_13925 [Planctomycetia bacterium]|jgi:hypothetical protein